MHQITNRHGRIFDPVMQIWSYVIIFGNLLESEFHAKCCFVMFNLTVDIRGMYV